MLFFLFCQSWTCCLLRRASLNPACGLSSSPGRLYSILHILYVAPAQFGPARASPRPALDSFLAPTAPHWTLFSFFFLFRWSDLEGDSPGGSLSLPRFSFFCFAGLTWRKTRSAGSSVCRAAFPFFFIFCSRPVRLTLVLVSGSTACPSTCLAS